jgi:hypothetical protein
MKMPLFNVSAWRILLLTLLLAIVSHYMLISYGIAHWSVGSDGTHVKQGLGILKSHPDWADQINSNEELLAFVNNLESKANNVVEAGHRLMGILGFYFIVGALSFLVSLLSPFCRPRWVSLICLPIGIVSCSTSSVVM